MPPHRKRTNRASTLVLVAASVLILLLVIIFALQFTSANLMGLSHRTAIDAAALAAADDIGKITINSPEVGLVSLSGAPPTGSGNQSTAKGNLSPDGWFDKVRSLDEIIGTARLDYLIAYQLDNNAATQTASDSNCDQTFLEKLATLDYSNALKARDELLTVIQASLVQGGSTSTPAYDANGNAVTPYDDALKVYLANQAAGSSYVPPTLKLTIGCIQGGTTTAIPIPNSTNNNVSSGQSRNGFYVSDTNIPCNGVNFVFGAITGQTTLQDKSKFCAATIGGASSANGGTGGTGGAGASGGTGSGGGSGGNSTSGASTLSITLTPDLNPSLPKGPSGENLAIPCAVKVDASQQYSLQGRSWTTNYTAVATAGGAFRLPTQAQLAISFPDGPLPEFTCLADLYATNWHTSSPAANAMRQIQTDLYTAANADYPSDPDNSQQSPPGNGTLSQNYTWTVPPFENASNPAAAEMAKICIYDWIRSAGVSANMDDVISKQTTAWDSRQLFASDGVTPAIMTTWNTVLPGTSTAISPPLGQIPQGFMYLYGFNSDGTVAISEQDIKPYPFMVVAENQMYAENSQPNGGGAGGGGSSGSSNNGGTGGSSGGSSHCGQPGCGASGGSSCRHNGCSTLGGCHGGDCGDPASGCPSAGSGAHPNSVNSKVAQWKVPPNPVTMCLPDGKVPPTYSSQSVQVKSNQYADVYFRNNIFQPGSSLGGKHAGNPLVEAPLSGTSAQPGAGAPGTTCNCSTGSSSGSTGSGSTTNAGGAPSMVSREDDFGSTQSPSPPFRQYTKSTSGPQARPTYTQPGLCGEIRFRRVVNVGALGTLLGNFNQGYVGLIN